MQSVDKTVSQLIFMLEMDEIRRRFEEQSTLLMANMTLLPIVLHDIPNQNIENSRSLFWTDVQSKLLCKASRPEKSKFKAAFSNDFIQMICGLTVSWTNDQTIDHFVQFIDTLNAGG